MTVSELHATEIKTKWPAMPRSLIGLALLLPALAFLTVFLVLPSLIRTDVSTGKLRIEFHAMKTATPEAATFNNQQIAALAAGKQNKLWFFIELFYHEQGAENSGYVTESYLQGLAQQVPGMSLPAWTAARSDPEFANALITDAQTANVEGFTGTPAFLIGKTGTTLQKFEPGTFGQSGPYIAAASKLLK